MRFYRSLNTGNEDATLLCLLAGQQLKNVKFLKKSIPLAVFKNTNVNFYIINP